MPIAPSRNYHSVVNHHDPHMQGYPQKARLPACMQYPPPTTTTALALPGERQDSAAAYQGISPYGPDGFDGAQRYTAMRAPHDNVEPYAVPSPQGGYFPALSADPSQCSGAMAMMMMMAAAGGASSFQAFQQQQYMLLQQQFLSQFPHAAAPALHHHHHATQPLPLTAEEMVQSIPVPTGCFLCTSETHWYTACSYFDGSKLCFINERDQRIYVMRHDDWIRGAVLRNVHHFLRVATGLAPSQYHLVVNGKFVAGDKGARCCDVGLLPGALVYVVLEDSCRYLLFSQPTNPMEDHVAVSQHVLARGRTGPQQLPPVAHYDEVEEEAEQQIEEGDEQNAADERHSKEEPSAPSDATLRTTYLHDVSSGDANVSHISVASTGLLRSLPTSHVGRGSLALEEGDTSAHVAETTPLSTDDTRDDSRCTEPRAARDGNPATLRNTSSSTGSSCMERPENISTWADLSVASHRSVAGNVCTANTTSAVEVGRTEQDACPHTTVAPTRQSQETRAPRGAPSAAQHHTVHIKFVPATMGFPELRKLFFAVGEVVKVRIVDPENTSTPPEQRFCVAFVEYADARGASACISQYDKMRLGRFRLAVSFSARPISGGYVTDAVGGHPCTFGAPNNVAPAKSCRNDKTTVGAAALGGTDQRVCATGNGGRPGSPTPTPHDPTGTTGTTLAASCTTPNASTLRMNARTDRSDNSSLADRCQHSANSDGGYKLTPKLHSPQYHHPNCHAVAALMATPPGQRSVAKGNGDDAYGTPAPRTVKKTVVSAGTPDRFDGGNRRHEQGSPKTVDTGVIRLHTIPSSRLRMLPTFDTILQLLKEYLRSSVQATYYNAHALLQNLSTTLATTDNDLLIDVVLLRIALHVHFGAPAAVQDAIELGQRAVIKAAFLLARPPKNDAGDNTGAVRRFASLFNVRHAVHCMIAAASLLQHCDDGLAVSLLAKTRDVACTTWSGCPSADKFKGQLEAFTGPFVTPGSSTLQQRKRGAKETRRVAIADQMFPTMCHPDNTSCAPSATGRVRAVAAILLAMEPAADLSRL